MRWIWLCEASLQRVEILRDYIGNEYPTDDIAFDKSIGICGYARRHGGVSKSQGAWIAANCRYRGLNVPKELRELGFNYRLTMLASAQIVKDHARNRRRVRKHLAKLNKRRSHF